MNLFVMDRSTRRVRVDDSRVGQVSEIVDGLLEHVGKMFDNLDRFRFELSETEREIVTALISAEEEVMDFRNVVLAEGNIEEWMVLALEEMKRSNRFLTKKAVFNYGKVSGENFSN